MEKEPIQLQPQETPTFRFSEEEKRKMQETGMTPEQIQEKEEKVRTNLEAEAFAKKLEKAA